MAEQSAYRQTRTQPRPYDPALRARLCDACGVAIIAGDEEETLRCEECGYEQFVPDASPARIPRGESQDEAARIAHLRTQTDHQWLTPASVAKFGNVLESELAEARAMWASIRKRLEGDPEDEAAVVELVCLAFEIHPAMPSETEAEQLNRRALIETTVEAVPNPDVKQKLLSNVVIGAVRAGQLKDAQAWLERMDPKSRSLDADSSFRLSTAVLAAANRDYAKVLEALGRAYNDIPIHSSSGGMVATLRGDALEKLGNLDAAVAVLYDQIKRQHSALALIKSVAKNMPEDWALCEQSLPLAVERDQGRLAKNIPLPQGSAVLWLLLAALVAIGAGIATGGVAVWAGVAVGVVLFGAAWVVSRSVARKRIEIIRGCETVNGRILALRKTGTHCELDVVVEREGAPDVEATTVQYLAPRILEMQIEGRAFDALWNPEYPTLFPRITINVSGDEAAKKDKTS